MEKQKVKFVRLEGEDIIFKTESGFEFPVPVNFIIGLDDKSYDKETYIDFIRKKMMKLNVYAPFELI